MQPVTRSTAALLIALTLLLSGALFLALSVGMFFSAFLPLLEGKNINATGTIYSFVFGFETLLLTVAAYFSLQKYRLKDSADQPVEFSLRGWQVAVTVIGLAAALGLGFAVSENAAVNWLILPIVTLPAASLPVILLFSLGARRLQLGSRWRVWSIFGLGMTVGPFLLFVIEIIILVIIIVLVSVFIASQPAQLVEIESLANQIPLLQNDPEALLELLSPYIVRPGVIVTVLAFTAFIVPFTEELLKPIGVWLFAGKLTSPAQGFALGALSGAAFGLVETLGSSAQTTGWAELLLTRIGTALLHITCSALVGWGIASAWHERRYLRLFVMYVGASSLHGVWNASVLMITFSAIASELNASTPLAKASPWMLGVAIAVGVLLGVILLMMNHRLARTDAAESGTAPSQPDVVT